MSAGALGLAAVSGSTALGSLALGGGAAHANPDGSGATAIVIGSGFGGAVAALRLGQAGIRTTVFERGRRWPIRADGKTFASMTAPDKRSSWFSGHAGVNSTLSIPVGKYPGLQDRIVGNGIEAVYGAGVGGGSLAFGAFAPQPRRRDFEREFPAGVDYSELARTYYRRAKKMLRTAPLPADILAHPRYVGARTWLNTVERYRPDDISFFDYAIDWDIVRQEIAGTKPASIINGELTYGVNSGAKNSVDHNYLPAAEATGFVTVKPMHEVFEIRPRTRGRGFIVTARVIDDAHRTVRTVTQEADYLFLGAGSYHTTSLLVKARARGHLPHLSGHVGEGYGTNGDFLVVRLNPSDDTGLVQGGPGYARIYEDDLPEGPVAIVYQATPLPSPLGKISTTHLVQAHTEERGSVDYNRTTGDTTLNYPFPAERSQLDRQAIAFINRFRQRTEGRFGRPANGVPVYSRATGFGSGSTYHGLGGVVMGKSGHSRRCGEGLRESVRRRRVTDARRRRVGQPSAHDHRICRASARPLPRLSLSEPASRGGDVSLSNVLRHIATRVGRWGALLPCARPVVTAMPGNAGRDKQCGSRRNHQISPPSYRSV